MPLDLEALPAAVASLTMDFGVFSDSSLRYFFDIQPTVPSQLKLSSEGLWTRPLMLSALRHLYTSSASSNACANLRSAQNLQETPQIPSPGEDEVRSAHLLFRTRLLTKSSVYLSFLPSDIIRPVN